MIFENISLLQTYQFILYSSFISNSFTAQFSSLQLNRLFPNSINANNFHINSFSAILNNTIKKEEIFDVKPFESVYGIGESKHNMLVGGIITIIIVFITNFAILAFYYYIKSKNNEGSNELSMSSSLFTNLNQDIKINPNTSSNLAI